MRSAERKSSPSKKEDKTFFGSFISKLRKRRIIETLVAFAGGGVVIIELAHHILVNHYHFPAQIVDICIVTLIGALLCTLTWRWFGGIKEQRNIKVEFFLISLFVLIAGYLDVRFVLQMDKSELFEIPEREQALETRSKNPVAIMYFVNNTGNSELNYWRRGLSDLLITDLSQSKYFNVLSSDRLYDILERLDQEDADTYSSEVLDKMASLGGIGYFLLGNYVMAGDLFRINVTLQEVGTGKILGSERVQGEGEQSILDHLVDDLTRKIKSNFKLSDDQIAGDLDRRIGQITTSSPEAYNYFIRGREFWNLGGRRDEALVLYERAVELDPEFARAYREIAKYYQLQGNSHEHRRYIQKAFELSDRISDRERYLIEGDYYYVSWETTDKAIDAYKKLLELYPDDFNGNNWLGNLYYAIEEYEKAIERFEVNRQNKVNFVGGIGNLALHYRMMGLYDKSKEVSEWWLNNFSDHWLMHKQLSWTYLCQGKYDLALSELDKVYILNPTDISISWRTGQIYCLMGNLVRAEEEFKRSLAVQDKISHLYGKDGLIALYLLQGRFEESKNQLEQIIELADEIANTRALWMGCFRLIDMHIKSGETEEALKQINALRIISEEPNWLSYWIFHKKGRAYLEMKSVDEARRTADELKELIEKGMNKRIIRIYYDLMGRIELERNRFSEAIEFFKKAVSLMPYQSNTSNTNNMHAYFIEPLALAYYKAGDREKAQEEYERIISLTTGRFYLGDIYTKSFYMLGKIFDEQSLKPRAIENYEKFLELWKDADPDIPEVEDAKKRLAGLKE